MEIQSTFALLLVALGGMMEGSFSLPLKRTPRWAWENIWGAGSLLALVLVPWPLAFATVPHLASLYTEVNPGVTATVFCFGVGWGLGGIYLGLAVAEIGMAIALSVIMGLIAIGGALVPMALQHRSEFFRPAGMAVLAGITIMIGGIVICAIAGHRKHTASSVVSSGTSADTRGALMKGLWLCIAAGVFSAMVNFALVFGEQIRRAAMTHGADPFESTYAIWAIAFTANYLVNIGYCVYLFRKKGTFTNYRQPGSSGYWVQATVMGLLWAGGIVIYGLGATRLGQFGPILGFPLMLIVSILTGNLLGVLSGEWKGTTQQSKLLMVSGVAVLLVAIGILSFANSLLTNRA